MKFYRNFSGFLWLYSYFIWCYQNGENSPAFIYSAWKIYKYTFKYRVIYRTFSTNIYLLYAYSLC